MKKFFVGIVLSILIFESLGYANAQTTPQPTLQVSRQRIEQRELAKLEKKVSIYVPSYVKYYYIDLGNLTFIYKPLDKKEIKKLSPNERKIYKKIARIQKYILRRDFDRAFNEQRNFLPTYVQYFKILEAKQDYRNAAMIMEKIISLNNTDMTLDGNILNYKLGLLYYMNEEYDKALKKLTPYADRYVDSDSYNYIMSYIHYNLGNYSSGIYYAKKVLNSKEYNEWGKELLYFSYLQLGNKLEARKYALELCKIKPSAPNFVRLAELTDNTQEKLTYLYKARRAAIEQRDISYLIMADGDISKIEQNKINLAMKKTSGYVEKPDWQQIENEISSMDTTINVSNRQYEFFKSTNNCISKYSGNNLTKCFESVNRKQEKLTQDLKIAYQREYEQRVRDMEYRRQQALVEEQNYNNMMYLNRLQSIQNQPRRTHCYNIGNHVYCDSY